MAENNVLFLVFLWFLEGKTWNYATALAGRICMRHFYNLWQRNAGSVGSFDLCWLQLHLVTKSEETTQSQAGHQCVMCAGIGRNNSVSLGKNSRKGQKGQNSARSQESKVHRDYFVTVQLCHNCFVKLHFLTFAQSICWWCKCLVV